MSELRELRGRELDAVGGGTFHLNLSFLNNVAGQNQFNNVGSIVGSQIGQQANIFSLNGIGVVA